MATRVHGSRRLVVLGAVVALLATPGARADELRPPEDAPETAQAPETMPLPPTWRPARPHPLIDINAGWQSRGPTPTANGQTEGIGGGQVVGAVHAIAAHPTDPQTLYLATVNGGVWKTTNANAASPNWVPQTDLQPSLSMGSLEFDPTDVTSETLLAGIGRFSSLGGQGGAILPGVLRTTDGGANWTLLTHALLNGETFTAVAARGNILMAASNGAAGGGGLFRSIDTGVVWTKVSGTVGTGLPNGSVGDLAGDRGTLSRFYCAVFGSGIYRSIDSGATWVNISSGNAALNAATTSGQNNHTELSVFPNGRLYVMAMLNGVVGYIGFSDNPAAVAPTWTQMDTPGTPEGPAIGITNATNANPIVVTTAVAHGLSNADGVIIAGVLGNTAANGITRRVAVVNTTQFQLTGVAGNGAYGGGGTVQKVSNLQPRERPGGQGGIHASLLVDAVTPTTVYVGGDRQDSPFPNFIGAGDFTARTWRGDTTVAPTGAVPSPQWEHLTHSNAIGAIPGGGTPGGSAPHADSRDFAFDASGRLIEVNDGGIYRRTSPADNTGDWISICGNLRCTEFHHIAYDAVGDVIYGPAQDTGTPMESSPGVWTEAPSFFGGFFKADGGVAAIDDVHFLPFSARYVSAQFLGGLEVGVWDNTNALLVAGNPALTWTNPGAFPDNTFTPAFYGAFEPNALAAAAGANRLIIGGGNGQNLNGAGVFESTDGGATITRISTQVIGDLAGIDPVAYGGRSGGVDNPDVLYFGSGSQVFVRTVAPPTAPAATTYAGGFVRDVAMDPDDWNTAFACDNDQVFMTTNAGGIWTDITGNLAAQGAQDFWALAYISDATLDGIAVGTGQGVFVARANNFQNWVRLGTGIPNVNARTLEYDATDDVLVAGTMGRGAWLLPNVTAAVDATPPTVTCTLNRRLLWPATRGLLDVGLTVTATDNFDPPGALVRSVGVTSDEAAGVAPYAPDGTLTGSTLRLRSERLVNIGANGRIFLIATFASDTAGNVGNDVCSAFVPLNLTVGHLTALMMEAATAEANAELAGGVPPPGYANPILPVTPLP